MKKKKKLEVLKSMRRMISCGEIRGFCIAFMESIYFLDKPLYSKNLEKINITQREESLIREKLLFQSIPELIPHKPETILASGFWFDVFRDGKQENGMRIRVKILNEIIEKLETNEL